MSISRVFITYSFVAYLTAGVVIIMVVAGANNINSQYSSGTHKTATVPSAFKPIEFVLDQLF